MTLQEFFVWVATGGGAIALASWIIEQVAWFQKLTTKGRWLVSLLGSIGFAIVAKLVIDFVPQEIIETISPYFAIVAAIVSQYLIGQVAHAVDPLRNLAEKEKENLQ